MTAMTTKPWEAGQPVSWPFGSFRRLVPATVLRDDGDDFVYLRILHADGVCEHRKVQGHQVVGVGQGDLFADRRGIHNTRREP